LPPIEQYPFLAHLSYGAKFFDDPSFALQLLEPVDTSAKDGNFGAEQNLSRCAFPYRRRIIGWRLPCGGNRREAATKRNRGLDSNFENFRI
jgi:hypothetical protein